LIPAIEEDLGKRESKYTPAEYISTSSVRSKRKPGEIGAKAGKAWESLGKLGHP
jgi:hypothetical protein